MSNGAVDLLEERGNSPLAVAEDFIMGRITPFMEKYVPEVVDKIILEAARIRLEAKGELAKLRIKTETA